MNELEKNNFGAFELIAVISQVLNLGNVLGVCFGFAVNICFDCDSADVVYVLSDCICRKIYA